MTTETFIEIMNSGEKILCGSDVHQYMGKLSQEAMKITAMINCGYHEPKEIRELFSLLTGREVDESFGMFSLMEDASSRIREASILMTGH